jgi:hypothetical protein
MMGWFAHNAMHDDEGGVSNGVLTVIRLIEAKLQGMLQSMQL